MTAVTPSPYIRGHQGAANYLQIGIREIYRLRHEIPHARRGRIILYRVDDLDRWASRHTMRRRAGTPT